MNNYSSVSAVVRRGLEQKHVESLRQTRDEDGAGGLVLAMSRTKI